MSSPKCQKCDRPATHKITRVLEGKAVDFYFCQEHAGEFSPLQGKSALAQMNLAQLLAGLLKAEQGQKADSEPAEGTDVKCRSCGLSFRQYRQTMLLGCSECYQSFERMLSHDLRRYHGTARHCGRQPEAGPGQVSQNENLEALKKRLHLAIQDEDFELAARLRDEIRHLSTPAGQPQASSAAE